jgi:excisionase family DNA binding protein
MSRVTAALRELELPDKSAADQAAQAVADLNAFLLAHPTPTGRVRLCTDEDGTETQVVIPTVAFRFFVDVLAELANGNAVTVAPVHAELTTQQAADLMNVSRPYLIKLLDEGRLPFRRVGNRRKVQLVDVLDYKRRDDARRQEVLDELTREAEDLGLYD